MIISNMEEIPGRPVVRHLGIVQGSTVQAKNVFRDIGASLKNLVGGELKSYTLLMNEARQGAIDRMKEEAAAIGANAILNVRFSTSTITQGAAEMLAYGTAVIVGDDRDG
ncbi:MAG: YbjQ family protein [Proteobacteria bacterium]|nr:YbjQ family protein [Pseudomonadota bacterium]